MVPNYDDSRSDDRENLPLEISIPLQSFSKDLEYITECLQNLRELQQLFSACSSLLAEDGLSHKLSIRHICLLLDIYMSHSENCWEEIKARVNRWRRTIEQRTDTAM